MTKAQVVAQARAPGNGTLADLLPAIATGARARASTSTRWAASCCWCWACTWCASLFSWLQGYLLNGAVQRTMYRLRSDVESKLNRLPLRYFDGQPRGEVLSRVTNDIDNVSQTLQQTLSQVLNSLLTIIAVVVMMLVISPLLALIALVSVPALDRDHPVHRRAFAEAVHRRSGRPPVSSTVRSRRHSPGTRWSRSSAGSARSRRRFAEHNEELYRTSFGAQFVSGIIMPAVQFIGNLNYVAVAVVGGLRVASGAMSLGDVQAFIQYSRQFTQPLTQVASMANVLQSGVASAERVFELLDAPEQSAGRRGTRR